MHAGRQETPPAKSHRAPKQLQKLVPTLYLGSTDPPDCQLPCAYLSTRGSRCESYCSLALRTVTACPLQGAYPSSALTLEVTIRRSNLAPALPLLFLPTQLPFECPQCPRQKQIL